MAEDTLTGIEKEPSEVKFKGIDLTTWLEEEEEVEDIWIYAYEQSSSLIKEFDNEDLKYIDITSYNEIHDIITSTEEWEIPDNWSSVRFIGQRESAPSEVTEEIIVGDQVGYDNPNRWIKKEDEGKYKVGIIGGDLGKEYSVKIEYETDAGRVENIYFPVKIVEG